MAIVHTYHKNNGAFQISGMITLCILWGSPGISFSQHPGPRYGHDLAYDDQREEVVLFGGFHSDGEPLADTWVWDGKAWKQVGNDGPSPRKWPAMAYDASRQRVVLFGGRTGIRQTGESLHDTWEWNGETWHRRSTEGPPARDHHRMVYDRKRERVVLFGGWDGEKLLADTWEWDGKQWLPTAHSGPSERAPFGMAYDEHNEQVVLFGGKTLDVFFADTWVWDGEQWIQREVQGPSARAFHAMTYDARKHEVLLFSGRKEDTMLTDTWAWDGRIWRKRSEQGPRKRGVYALVYDHARQQALFYGSGTRVEGAWILDAETWTWDGSNWHRADGL